MTLMPFLQWLEHGQLGTAIRQSTLLFPVIESLHVLAITAMVGTIAVVDLRLLGIASRERPIDELMDEVLPFTRWAFAAAALSGSLLFISHAVDYSHKLPFLIKMGLLLLALVNILVFHRLTVRNIQAWNHRRLPLTAKLGGGISLAIWIAIVAAGRWIGFV